jgi:hypothetical protein
LISLSPVAIKADKERTEKQMKEHNEAVNDSLEDTMKERSHFTTLWREQQEEEN